MEPRDLDDVNCCDITTHSPLNLPTSPCNYNTNDWYVEASQDESIGTCDIGDTQERCLSSKKVHLSVFRNILPVKSELMHYEMPKDFKGLMIVKAFIRLLGLQ